MPRPRSGVAHSLGRSAAVVLDLGGDAGGDLLRIARLVRVERVLADPRAEDPPGRALGEAVLVTVGAVRASTGSSEGAPLAAEPDLKVNPTRRLAAPACQATVHETPWACRS